MRDIYLWKEIRPLTFGGGQERKMRPGTLPTALIGGFGLAAELEENNSTAHEKACKAIKKQFLKEIKGLNYKINEDENYCIPSTINISFDEVDAEGLFVEAKGLYALSNGSACESGSYTPSYVLEAMELGQKRIDEVIRISWGYNTKADFFELVDYVRGMQEG